MGIKINQYVLERLTFGDDDYYDIDYFDGANYQTAKILGSTIKAGINAGIIAVNLYSDNGQLATDRVVGGNFRSLSLGTDADSLRTFELVTTGLGDINCSFRLRNHPTAGENTFEIGASNSTDIWFAIQANKVRINDEYFLPNVDGILGQVITTDGAGVTSWATPTGGGSNNIYNIDGVIPTTRTVVLDDTLVFMRNGQLNYPSGVPNFIYFDVDNFSVRPQNAFAIQDPVSGTDWFTVSNGVVSIFNYALPLADGTAGQVIKTDGLGVTTWEDQDAGNAVNISSTQWSKTLASAESLPDGGIANGFTFFTNADKVLGGTTSYNEFNIQYGIEIELSGTNGTADIVINGTTYVITFLTDLDTSALTFVTTNETALNLDNVRIFNLDADANSPFGNKNARLRFCTTELIANGITITNVTGDIAGSISNPFVPLSTVSYPDHCLVPYVGEAYEGQRLHHTFRVNFGIGLGNVQTMALSLRRYSNDSIIASEIQVIRSNDEEGQQHTFASYTAGATDPFVLGGFYFALRNDSGSASTIVNGLGILIQNEFQKPTNF